MSFAPGLMAQDGGDTHRLRQSDPEPVVLTLMLHCHTLQLNVPRTLVGPCENTESDLRGLGWSLRVYSSNALPGDDEAAGLLPTLRTTDLAGLTLAAP